MRGIVITLVAAFGAIATEATACSGFSSSSDGSGTDPDAAMVLDGPGIGGDAGPVESGVNDDAGAAADAACGPGANKRVFVSSSPHIGNFGGVAGADQSCRDSAAAAKLCGEWKAWLGSPDAGAAESRMTKVERYLLNGTKAIDAIGGNLVPARDGDAVTASIDEYGIKQLSAFDVWVGGTSTGAHCDEWTNASDAGTGAATAGNAWNAAGVKKVCVNKSRFLCFEQ